MFAALALGALSFGGQLLSGMGAKQASAKQARMQMIADEMARQRNEETLARVNARREEIGKTLLDARNVVATAEAAGFNPVTWINGGGLGYMTDAAKFLVPEYQLTSASQVPQQHSMLSAFGNALSAGASAFGTQYRADMSYNLQQQKLNNAQDALFFGLSSSNAMRGVQSMGASSGGNYFASPGITSAGTLSSRGASGGSKDKDAFWPGYEHAPTPVWEAKKPESTNPFPPDWGWKIPPGFANAEAWEDSMGELVSLPYGVYKLANTAMYNVLGYTVPDIYREAKAGAVDLVNYANKAWGSGWGNRAKPSIETVSPYIPAGMPRSIAYPAWATP